MKRYKVLCPLLNFKIQNVLMGKTKLTKEETMNLFREREKKLVEGIEIFDGIKARRISKEDFEDLNAPLFSAPHRFRRISAQIFVLEKYITVENGHDFSLDQIMRNIALALRLLRKGYVSGSYVFYILVSEERRLTSWSTEEEPREPEEYMYGLNYDEIPALKKLVKKIQSVDFEKRKSLHLACKRFQRAYEESNAEDKLIDFMIAFEALFLRGEKAVSTGQIIAIACSTLLGKTDAEREEISQLLTEAYSIRNYIVHGSEYKKMKSDDAFYIEDFVSNVEDYLRESIKKLLN